MRTITSSKLYKQVDMMRFKIRPGEILISFLLLLVGVVLLYNAQPTKAESLAQQLSGKILLQVEDNGEAWYIYPETHQRYFLGRPEDAFELMRKLGLGISNANIEQIPVSDTFNNGNRSLRNQLAGKILLQVEENGEAWYVYPDDTKRYFLGRPADAFALMRELGLGISTENLISIPIAADSVLPDNGGNSSQGESTEGNLGDRYDSDRTTLLTTMNAERSALGIAPFTLVQEVSQAAQKQADDMTSRKYFEFTSFEGKTISDWIKGENYVAHTVAENLVQTNKGVSSIVGIWKGDLKTSYDNIVSAKYRDVGIGVGSFEGVPIYTVVFALSLEDFFTGETADLQSLDQVRNQMLVILNDERIKEGLQTLTMNSLLNQAAQGHTDDMLARSYYAHNSPEGSTSFDRIKTTGYLPSFTAENIAKGQFSVAEVMDSWMNSPAHRANILSDKLEEVGFGLSLGENLNGYEVIWAQNFGTPL